MDEQINLHDTSGNLPPHLQVIVDGLDKIIEHLKSLPERNSSLSKLVGVIEKTCSPETNNVFLGPEWKHVGKHVGKEVNLKKILRKFEPLFRVTCTKAELKSGNVKPAQVVVEEYFHSAVADVALFVYSGSHDGHDLHSKIISTDNPVYITMGCSFQEFMASLHSQKSIFNIENDQAISLMDCELMQNDGVYSLQEPAPEYGHISKGAKHLTGSNKQSSPCVSVPPSRDGHSSNQGDMEFSDSTVTPKFPTKEETMSLPSSSSDSPAPCGSVPSHACSLPKNSTLHSYSPAVKSPTGNKDTMDDQEGMELSNLPATSTGYGTTSWGSDSPASGVKDACNHGSSSSGDAIPSLHSHAGKSQTGTKYVVDDQEGMESCDAPVSSQLKEGVFSLFPFANDSVVPCAGATPEHACPSSEDTALFCSLTSESQKENEDLGSDCGAVASCILSSEGDADEILSSSWTWESRLFHKVSSHQELPSVMERASAMRSGAATECAVTIIKEPAFFDKLLMERLSAYVRPIIGISSSHGWLLVHFWEGESYAVDLGALSPGTNQDLACSGIKVAGGTPDNIHKWAIIHSVGAVLSDISILKVVYNALDLSYELEKSAGLNIVRVFDVLEADRIIRSHNFVMPLEELLVIYGIVPYSSVDIVMGSQRIPVPDDLKDYCGKSQHQAISSLREMARVYSRMIPFLYQSMLSIMSAPMLTELDQRSDATVQSPEESDYWYNPREGSMISGPVELPSRSLSYAAAVEGLVKAENTTLQVTCLGEDTSCNARVTEHERTVTEKETVTPKKHRDEHEGEMQEQNQQDEKMESGEPDTGSQQGWKADLHSVTSNNGKKEKKQKEQFDCDPKDTIYSISANTLEVKAKCLMEDAHMEQDPPHLMEGATCNIREAVDESTHMQSHISSKQQNNEQEPKHAHDAYSKEGVNCPQMNSAQTKIGNQPSPATTNRIGKLQESNLNNSVRPKTANHTASAFVAVAATNPHRNQEKQQEQLPECIQAACGRRKRKKKKKKQLPPPQKSEKALGFANPQGACQKGLNQIPAQKSVVTLASGQAHPKKQTSSSKSPGVAVVKEKNQLKVKDQNDFKSKETRGLGITGPAKIKEQINQSKSHPSSKEKGKTQVPQRVMQTNVQTKNTNADKTSASAKAKEQSKSLPSPGAASKKEQKQVPQPKVQNDKKPQKKSETGGSGPAKTKDKKSPSKNPNIAKEVVQSKQNQKLQNDVKSKKMSVISVSSPGKSKDQQPKQEKHQQKEQENSKVKYSVNVESKKKKKKESNDPALRTEKEQHPQEKQLPEKCVISISSPSSNSKDQQPKQEKHQQNEQENFKVKDSVKIESKEKKKKESNDPALRTGKEQHPQEKHVLEKLPLPSPLPSKPPPRSPPSSSIPPLPLPEWLPQQENQSQKQQDHFQQVESKKKKKKESSDPALRTEKEEHPKEKPLPEKLPLSSPLPPSSSTPPLPLPEWLPQPEKQAQKQQDLFQQVESKKKKKKESNDPALRTKKEQHPQEKLLPEKLPLQSPLPSPSPPSSTPPLTLPEWLPQQEKQAQKLQVLFQQEEQQIQPIEAQNLNAELNKEMFSKYEHLDSENMQSEVATVQQQNYQPLHPQKENTNLQQQYHQAQHQQEQKTSMQQQYYQTQQQQQQQQQNTSKMKQQMHQPQHQPILLQQQPQQLTQPAFLPDVHHPGNVQVGGSPLRQYQPVPMCVNQGTGPVRLPPRNPVDARVMPNATPPVIPQIPLGVVLQAPTYPSQQVTPFLQWEQQLKRQVKTSPEKKISILPQWMKPMVLQFQEDNRPVFVHPLSEQASTPINPCNITDEEEDEFEDLLESDVTTFVKAFPENIQLALQQLSQENSTCSYAYLAELVMDVGRQPKARYLKSGHNFELTEKVLNHGELTKQDMQDILKDSSLVRTCNSQVMIMDTLHRLGLLKNAQGEIIGMTAKVRHPLPGCLNPLYDVFNKDKSILVMGPTGVGKTTLLREAARVLSGSQRKSVFVIDTLSEMAGEGDIPHQSIGSARRLQVLESNLQHKVMKEAYQNHRPDIVIIDEISSLEEAKESLNMRLKGIQLIAGVQGQTISDILQNPELSLVTGGITESAIVGNQGGKTARLRAGPVVFDILIEMLDRERWMIHWDFGSTIDALLPGGNRSVGVEERKVVKLKEDDSGLVSQVLAVQVLAEYRIYSP